MLTCEETITGVIWNRNLLLYDQHLYQDNMIMSPNCPKSVRQWNYQFEEFYKRNIGLYLAIHIWSVNIINHTNHFKSYNNSIFNVSSKVLSLNSGRSPWWYLGISSTFERGANFNWMIYLIDLIDRLVDFFTKK